MKANETENNQRSTYQTGEIHPPKGRQGLVALLLAMVIVLGGVVSVLSIMNIRLFHLLDEQTNPTDGVPMSFSHTRQNTETGESGTKLAAFGFVVQDVTNMWRYYYGWPQGVYISKLTPDGPAARAGLRLGDVVMSLDGTTLTEERCLAKFSQLTPGSRLPARIFREGRQFTLMLTAWE